MSSRLDRLKALQQTTKDYIAKEKTRIENEVSVMEAILKGRTGGAGVQAPSTTVVAAVAQNDLSDFLNS
jgi:hypothetical protein